MVQKFSRLLAIPVISLCLASPGFASDLYIVHGINGNDLGFDEDFPVDISVNGACALTGVPFRTISDPVPFDPGQYDIEVRVSDGACGGVLAVVATIDVQFGENASVVAHLTEGATPTLTKFVNDVRATDRHDGRAVVRHTAAAPPVTVVLRQNHGRALLKDIRNGEQRAAEVSSGNYHATIRPFGEPRIGPLALGLEAAKTSIVYAVGSLKNGTFEPLVQVLDTSP